MALSPRTTYNKTTTTTVKPNAPRQQLPMNTYCPHCHNVLYSPHQRATYGHTHSQVMYVPPPPPHIHHYNQPVYHVDPYNVPPPPSHIHHYNQPMYHVDPYSAALHPSHMHHYNQPVHHTDPYNAPPPPPVYTVPVMYQMPPQPARSSPVILDSPPPGLGTKTYRLVEDVSQQEPEIYEDGQ